MTGADSHHEDRRIPLRADRRHGPRGGRRESDVAGRDPVVLLADAYHDARTPVARYLDRYGFEVLEVSTAAEAVEILERRQPRAVISGLHGLEAAMLHRHIAASTIPSPVVIALISSPEDHVPAHVRTVLEKPFLLRTMLEELRRELKQLPSPS